MRKLKHTLCIMFTLILTMTSILVIPVSAESTGDTIITVPITVQEEYSMANEFFQLMNQKRAEAGLPEYKLDAGLMDLAMERAAQCCIYFSHGSMTYERSKHFALEGTYVDEYGSYEDFFKGQLFQENIAEGLADAQSTYTVWHGSSGHNAVMMDSSNFKYCGVGVVTYHGKKEWVLVVSKAPVGNTIDKVSGSKTNTRDIRLKTKYLAGGTMYLTGLHLKTETPFEFADLDGEGNSGYSTADFPNLFTYRNNTPDIIDVDNQGRITTKSAGVGSFTVFYRGTTELCTVNVNVKLSYADRQTENVSPTEPPKQMETAKPTSTPDPQPPKQTETTKPAEPPKQTEGKTDVIGPATEETNDSIGGNNQTGTQTEPETKNPPKQTEPSKPVKPVSRKLTVKVKNVTYNGKAQKPAVTVYAGKKKLSSKYYTVSYKNNKNVGYGTVVVKGKGSYGKYSGTAVFKINLKKTKLSSAKSTKRKTFTTTWKKTGGNSGWQVQYSTNKKFRSGVRTVNLKANNTKLTVRKLRSRKNYYVRIRSYKKVGKQTWYSGWSNVKCVKIK